MNRRSWMYNCGLLIPALAIAPACSVKNSKTLMAEKEMAFKLSLAQWSLHKAIFGKDITHLQFAGKANELGFNAIEYVNQFFKDKAEDLNFLDQMNTICGDLDMKQLLIMIDREGNLGAPDDKERKEAISNHYKWVHAAKYLGCHSIRVNAFGIGTRDEVMNAAVDGLGSLSEYASKENINVIVENHGSYSSDGTWLSTVMKKVNKSNCGTLPDFGNFCIERGEDGNPCKKLYDKYKGVDEMMPFAKAVSAKANVFDENGDEAEIDFYRMVDILKKHNYTGFVGIEYEGNTLSEIDGILATKRLLEKAGAI